MKPDDLKNSIDNIKADSYMETRLFAAVADVEKPRKKNRKMLKTAVCTALCFAVFVAGIGIGISKKSPNGNGENIVASDVDYSGNYFVMTVYASVNDKKSATPIDDHTVVLPDYKLEKRIGLDGVFEIHGSSENSNIGVNGENIKTVKIKCETGTLCVWDYNMLEYLRENNMYYDVIVPYSAEYENHNVDERCEIFLKHIKNGDYDEYIKGKNIRPYDEYISADIEYDKDGNEVGVGLVSKESYYKIHPASAVDDWQTFKEYTFQNVFNLTEDIVNSVSWNDPISEEFLNNPDTPFTEIPHDTITLEVTFNDNSVQYASYDFSFNENGELVIERIIADN